MFLAGCQSSKIVEVPVEKIVYVEKPRLFKEVPLCEIPYAKDTSIGEIIKLAPRLRNSLDKCNIQIREYNKSQ